MSASVNHLGIAVDACGSEQQRGSERSAASRNLHGRQCTTHRGTLKVWAFSPRACSCPFLRGLGRARSFGIGGTLFVLNMLIPDPLPLVDEFLILAATILLSRMAKTGATGASDGTGPTGPTGARGATDAAGAGTPKHVRPRVNSALIVTEHLDTSARAPALSSHRTPG
jgi:hypothetical protein